jgi:elongation factor Ts
MLQSALVLAMCTSAAAFNLAQAAPRSLSAVAACESRVTTIEMRPRKLRRKLQASGVGQYGKVVSTAAVMERPVAEATLAVEPEPAIAAEPEPAPKAAPEPAPEPAAKASGGAIDAKTVKKLRDQTGAGMMDCKKALVDANGDVEVATEALRKKGLASAEKKASRAATEGVIEKYIHTGAKLGVMVEVNCETDFVAKRIEFQELAKAIAMQIAACPAVEVVSEADIDDAFIEKEKALEAQSEDLQGKPAEIVDKIVAGRVAKLVKTKLLLEQPYIRDPNMSVDELVKSYISKLGENIKVARFMRFNVGETSTPDADDEE